MVEFFLTNLPSFSIWAAVWRIKKMIKPVWRLKYTWQTLKEITPPQRRCFLNGMIVHWISLLAIRTIGFGKYFSRLNQFLGQQNLKDWPPSRFSSQFEKATIIDKACRYTSRSSTCLSRSITIYWMMRRQKVPVELQIGFRTREDIVEGHAWIELDGRVLNDESEVQVEYAIIENIDILNGFRKNKNEKYTFN